MAPMAAALTAELATFAALRRIRPADVVAGWIAAERATMATEASLAELEPDHRAYTRAQNLMSVLSEPLSGTRSLQPLTKLLRAAQNRYASPSHRPHAPITVSFYTYWMYCDACQTPAGETLATCVLALGTQAGLDPEFLRILALMERSRMGLYEQLGRTDGSVRLRDLATGEPLLAFDPVSYAGPPGEVWYARVLPPPQPGRVRHVVVTTPYVVTGVGATDAARFITSDAAVSGSGGGSEGERLAPTYMFLKYGPEPLYWLKYVDRSCRRYQANAIFLEGLPEIPARRASPPK